MRGGDGGGRGGGGAGAGEPAADPLGGLAGAQQPEVFRVFLPPLEAALVTEDPEAQSVLAARGDGPGPDAAHRAALVLDGQVGVVVHLAVRGQCPQGGGDGGDPAT